MSQIGGAAASLEMATGFAKQRHAFGRPIGSFQAIKHKMSNLFIAIERARALCYFAVAVTVVVAMGGGMVDVVRKRDGWFLESRDYSGCSRA